MDGSLSYLPTTFFFPIDWSARALMTLPRLLSDWLIAEPSFSLSPVAPVESALSLRKRRILLNFIAYWVIFHVFLSSADFFQNQLFLKILSGVPSECQTVWILIRPNFLSGLILVQTVCKGYQQTTLIDK